MGYSGGDPEGDSGYSGGDSGCFGGDSGCGGGGGGGGGDSGGFLRRCLNGNRWIWHALGIISISYFYFGMGLLSLFQLEASLYVLRLIELVGCHDCVEFIDRSVHSYRFAFPSKSL